MTPEDLANRFNYHAPNDSKRLAHQDVRMYCMQLADFLNGNLPEGREKAVAVTKLEEVMFWANAALARS